MLYFDEPILNTQADGIVVPVSLSGVILPGLQQSMVDMFGEAYLEDMAGDIRRNRLGVGRPSIFIHSDNFPFVVNFPIESITKIRDLELVDMVDGIKKLFYDAKMAGMASVAVPWLGKNFSWDTQESVMNKMEMRMYQIYGVELWLYPPDEGEDFEVCRPGEESLAESLLTVGEGVR
jgi:hypothetical protein